jgi:prepilin-type N-terminal cleavage/methylation domain-containing protein
MRRGFTLIELLVVIAIIAALLGILLPSFSEARHQARKVTCMSNFRQIQLGFETYFHDFNGRVPFIMTPMHNNAFGANPAVVADAALDPYKRFGETPEEDYWPQSLPNVFTPAYLGEERGVYVCPSAVNGWPRENGEYEYTVKPAGANQPNGIIQTKDTGSEYLRESFGFLDGRVFWRFRREKTHDWLTDTVYQDLYEQATFVRDLIKRDNRHTDERTIVGPHRGGAIMLNRNLEVEFRTAKDMMKSLVPAFDRRGAQF